MKSYNNLTKIYLIFLCMLILSTLTIGAMKTSMKTYQSKFILTILMVTRAPHSPPQICTMEQYIVIFQNRPNVWSACEIWYFSLILSAF